MLDIQSKHNPTSSESMTKDNKSSDIILINSSSCGFTTANNLKINL